MSATNEHAIAQEAGAWLYRLRDECSTEDQAEFGAWLQTSPQHVAEFLLATARDIDLGSLAEHRQLDIDALIAAHDN